MSKTKALDIAQRYLGMQPKDLGCDTWTAMNEKLANEILALVNAPKQKIIIVDNDPETTNLIKQVEEYHKIGLTHNDYLLNDMLKLKTSDLIGKTTKLAKECNEMEVKGQRGKTNNRKIKPRKKSKNGKK